MPRASKQPGQAVEASPDPPTYLTTKAEIARTLGITRQRLNYHAQWPGFPTPDDAGRYRTQDVLAFGRANGLIQSQPPTAPAAPNGVDAKGGPARYSEWEFLDLNQERARLAKEQADAAAIKNAQSRGELLEVAAVEAAWDMIRSSVRLRVLAMAPKIESQCNLAPEARARLRKILDREIDDLLTELSKPPDYEIEETPDDAGDGTDDP